MLLLFFACQNNTVWTMQYSTETNMDCFIDNQHNFLYAVPVDEDDFNSDWTYTTNYVERDDLSLFQITSNGGDAFLMMGGDIIPGSKEGGEWVFTWDDIESGESELVHVAGYEYKTTYQTKTTVTFKFNEGKGTGSLLYDLTEQHDDYETDLWDYQEVGLYEGELYYSDSSNYLYNSSVEQDCDGLNNMCFLLASSECSSNTSFTAAKTALESIEGFENYSAP